MRIPLSASVEDYLKTIYQVELDHKPVSTSEIAERMGVNPIGRPHLPGVPFDKLALVLGAIVGLTHDYGNRLKYYGWRTVQRIWPSQGDFDLSEAAGGEKISDFDSFFREQVDGMDYFLVTLFSDLDAQPALKSMLYDHYPILLQGDGFVLFDLHHPK